MAENITHHSSCLRNQMFHSVTSSSAGCLLTAAPSNVLSEPKHLQSAHAVIPVVQPGTVVAQIDPRVLLEHRDGQFVTIPTFELQPLPQTDINEKIAIYRHPLFPLLRILFEKCELSTSYVDLINAGSFDNEIREFITQMAKENKPFFTDDEQVDSLILKSLQVLRIHLLELEKVNELCKDFCSRYISCLKGKLNSENVMKTLDLSTSPVPSPSENSAESNINIMDTTSDIVSMNTNEPSASTSKAVDDQSQSEQGLSRSTSLDSTPGSSESSVVAESYNELTSGFLSKKTKGTKRGVLPKSATAVLKAWLFQHLVHPYPTEDEKRELAQQTNLSNLQVNNWFINARRRILQPMLESSSSFLKTNKKSKQQRNAAQKDWTNTIGIYNAYRTEALQNSVSDQQQQTANNNLVASVAWVPSNSSMLASLRNRSSAQTIQSQPVQLLQVPQTPVQSGSSATTYLTGGTPHVTSQNQVFSSCHSTITLPVYSQAITVPVTQQQSCSVSSSVS